MENEQKQYELICILDPHLEKTDLDNFKQEIEKLLTNNSGQLVHFTEPQKRDLSYPINKQNQGIYVISHISLGPQNVINFLKELKTNKQILRHLINVLEVMGPEKPRMPRRPKTRKEEGGKTSTFAKASADKTAGKDNRTKLEEIDKKLDELVGL